MALTKRWAEGEGGGAGEGSHFTIPHRHYYPSHLGSFGCAQGLWVLLVVQSDRLGHLRVCARARVLNECVGGGIQCPLGRLLGQALGLKVPYTTHLRVSKHASATFETIRVEPVLPGQKQRLSL